jgi:hypothetical protein
MAARTPAVRAGAATVTFGGRLLEQPNRRFHGLEAYHRRRGAYARSSRCWRVGSQRPPHRGHDHGRGERSACRVPSLLYERRRGGQHGGCGEYERGAARLVGTDHAHEVDMGGSVQDGVPEQQLGGLETLESVDVAGIRHDDDCARNYRCASRRVALG